MADDAERAPDTSGLASFGEIVRSFTQGTSDPDALMSALKASRMPSVPLSQMGSAAESVKGMRWCQRCRRPEPENAGCPNASFAEASEELLPSVPADPFPDTDVLAGMGVAQMLDAMEAGGVPPLRAERIVGAMLAAHGMMTKEAGSDEG